MITPLLFALTVAHLPGFFEPNLGQFGEDVLYVARSTSGLSLFTGTNAVDSTGVILELPKAHGAKFQLRGKAQGTTNYDTAVFVPRYEKLVRFDVAQGIDAIYSLDEKGTVQCDFIGHPGSDLTTLEILFRGVDRVFIDSKGKLTLRTMTGKNIEPAMRFLRIVDGRQVPIEIQPLVRRDGVVVLAEMAAETSLLGGGR